MFFVPGPGGGHDVFELREFWFPAQFANGFFGGGDQFGRVAGTSRFFHGGNFFARHLLAHLNDFAHGVAVAVAQVVKSGLARLQAEDVRLRQVHDVNVIADARAVGRRIVRAENFGLRQLAEHHLQHPRNQMGFDAVMFAEFFARAGGVEVTEGDELQAVNFLIPLEDFLEHQLGFAVGIDRALRQILGHRNFVGRAVGGARRAEDEFFHAAFDGGIGQFERVDDVVVKILFRVGHGFADECAGGEVHDGVGLGGS